MDIQNRSASESGGQPDAQSSGDVLRDVLNEVKALRESNEALHARVEQFTSQGEAGVDAHHVNHIMQKHFWNDLPDGRPLPGSDSKAGSG